jgi:hypothetical protein
MRILHLAVPKRNTCTLLNTFEHAYTSLIAYVWDYTLKQKLHA